MNCTTTRSASEWRPAGMRRAAAGTRPSTARREWRTVRRPSPAPAELVGRVREVEDRTNPLHVHATAQHEQGEEAQRDQEVTQTERQPALRRHRWEDDEEALAEGCPAPHDGDHDPRRVPPRP